MANQLLTIGMITRESLMVLSNQLRFAKRVYRKYDKEYGVAGAQIGTVLNVRKPPKYTGRSGDALQIEDATESSVQLTLTNKFGVDIAFSTTDLTLSIDDFKKRFISPGVIHVANQVDADGLLQYLNVYNSVGTPGSVPNTLLLYLQAQQKLDEEAAPRDDLRAFMISPAMSANIVDALKGLFQASDEIAEQYLEGLMGRAAGGDWYMTQNIASNTTGALGGAGVVNGGGQSGSSLVTDTWNNSVTNLLKKGNVITLAGVHAVNPQTKVSTGALRDFVLTADASSDGSGNATLSISPPIILTGPFQNVDGAAADEAVITVFGAANTVSPQGLVFHESAFALGTADLVKPQGVWEASREADDQLGLSIRMVKQYDINSDRVPTRLDILYGWTTLYPELACRVMS